MKRNSDINVEQRKQALNFPDLDEGVSGRVGSSSPN